ncbi:MULTISPECIES: thermonuclease family protein [Lentibacter]|jgi:micrococcal nuclease|uniref:Nuclease homologue n=1 Tax=Lentibacter algarum TaxID=576131 RepID=A0A1H3MC30_9RHOB|nr:thermonuclease family protein [Lentibacter algarum]MCO4776022.1 thermonuclease family protein [Lentibacter algarum]MCO4828032.1 thermonuclease family protein [Lentibacter algarum]WIF33034.1 Succinoglycan biosynthesis protein ExoI [Lentibacter algarum]SDY74133.1 nuclease homologue [Lentibacter algarum]
MEFLIIIFILWLAIHAAKKSARSGSSRKRERDVLRSINEYSKRAKDREPYDPQNSDEEPKHTVLEGAAFVVDGDTILIMKTQIRLFGIDAAEMNHPYGKKAKWALVDLCNGQCIRAEIMSEDNHGRTVAKCFLPDGRDLSAEMVKLGLAIDWPKFSGGIYRDMEVEGVRNKLWLADARQKGRMYVWERFEARQNGGGFGRSVDK